MKMKLRYTGGKPEREVFQVFNDTMRQLITEDPRVVYLDADLMGSMNFGMTFPTMFSTRASKRQIWWAWPVGCI